MPLEISEIGISMRVSESGGDRQTNKNQPKAREGECDDLDREEIVDDCVRRVLQVLKTRGGR